MTPTLRLLVRLVVLLTVARNRRNRQWSMREIVAKPQKADEERIDVTPCQATVPQQRFRV